MLSCRTRAPPAKRPGGAGGGSQAASPSRSSRLRLGSHKLSLLCLFRFLPVVREKAQEELKQPRPPAQPRLQLPACVPPRPGTVRPRDLPALHHISGSGPGQKRQQELPTIPALLPCPSPRRLTLHVWRVGGLQGTRSLRTERAEKRLRLLMASKRQEVEAEVWRQYRANRAGQNMERGQVRHALHSPQETGISPPRSLGGEQGRSPCTGTAALLWPTGQAGLFCLPAALNVALQEELSLRPKRTVACGTGSLFRARTSLRGVSTTALKTKPSLRKSLASAEALGAAPAIGGSALGESLPPLQSPCRHLFEDPYRPPHLLRKAYAEKLKERLQEKERCQSAARQRASEQRAELHLPGRAGEV